MTASAGKSKQVLEVQEQPGKAREQLLAEVSLCPTVLGGVAAVPWAEKLMGDINMTEALTVMRKKGEAAAAGDLDAAKAMLMSQAVTLDAIFNDMARRAANLIRTNPDGSWTFTGDTMEVVTRIAFKAQGQCRSTLQTLGDLVNPRSVAFIKQANMANGAQQVNNGASPSRPQEGVPAANQLLEANASERLDIGAPAAPGRVDSKLEAMGAVHGPKNFEGEGRRSPECDQTRNA